MQKRTLLAVIFDMDGLMVDTEHLHHKSFKIVLKQHGITPGSDDLGSIHVSGISASANWKHLMSQYGLEADIRKLTDMKNKAQAELLKQGVIAAPGLFSLLKDLRKSRIKIAIASSSIREHINMIVDKLGINHYFDAIVSGEDVKRGKPAPDIFLQAAQYLGITPSKCLVLEDASNGVQAAKAAGMKVIAVPNDFTRSENFEKADAVASSLKEVYALLDRL